MLNKGKNLTSDQKSVVQETLAQHNPRKAYEQVGEFLKQNRGETSNNSVYPTNTLKMSNNMQFNPIRNQYTNQNKNISDRKWY